MDSRDRENVEQYAREMLRERAQNEATCIALSGLFNQAQIEIASMTAEVDRLRAELAARDTRDAEQPVRYVARHHIKEKPTEANPCPVRVHVVAEKEPGFDILSPEYAAKLREDFQRLIGKPPTQSPTCPHCHGYPGIIGKRREKCGPEPAP